MEVTEKPAGKRSSAAAIVLGIVLLAVVGGAAFYQQELLNYYRLQGWNTGAVKQTMERFVREANEGKASAGELLDPAFAQPKVEGDKFVGVTQSSARGPSTTPVKTFAPEATIKDCEVRIKNRSGVFQADVQYPNGQWAPFDVDRINGALRIRSVPDALSPTRPPVQPWD
jgi:hypothetical protein